MKTAFFQASTAAFRKSPGKMAAFHFPLLTRAQYWRLVKDKSSTTTAVTSRRIKTDINQPSLILLHNRWAQLLLDIT